MLQENNYLEIITECITEVLFASKDLGNHYINEVIGSGYAVSKLIKKHCSKVHILSKSNQYLVFCKHAACFLLNISRCKYQTIIQIQLAKDVCKLLVQINLPIPPFITAALCTGISDLTMQDTLQPDKREENPLPLSSLPNPIPSNDLMIYTFSRLMPYSRASTLLAVLIVEAALVGIQLLSAALPDVNDNMHSPSTLACLRLLATPFENYTCLSSSLSTSACPKPSAASAVPTAEVAPI